MKIRVELEEKIIKLKEALRLCDRFRLVPKEGDIMLEEFMLEEVTTKNQEVFLNEVKEQELHRHVRRLGPIRDLTYDWEDIFASLDGKILINDLLLQGLGYKEHTEVTRYLDTYQLLEDCLKKNNNYCVSVEKYHMNGEGTIYDFVLWYTEEI